METREHFGIVGGGLLGLTLALRLAEGGKRVTVLEAADHLGGLADAWQLGDVTWDRHYHVTLLSDQHLRGLLRALNLDDQMQWRKTRTGFLVEGKLYSLSSAWEFLQFPPLRLLDKLRLGWTIWHASRLTDWRKLEQIPVADWLRRHSGLRTLEKIWLPLLKAKLGNAWERTSAAFIWATIQRMYAARHSGHKHELFGYLPGGYARLLASLAERLESLGVEIQTSAPAKQVTRNAAGQIDVELTAETFSFDRVVVTTPTPVTAQLCTQLSAKEMERLRGVEYLGILCASLLLKKPLAGYYVTNITDPAPFTGVIEMTALVEPAELCGHTLVYLPKYVTADDATASKSDDEIKVDFLAAFQRLYPGFDADDVLAFRLSRVRNVFALSTLGYSQRVPTTATSVPGLFIVNSSQIVNGTLNVNETVRLAESSLATLCQPLASQLILANDDEDCDSTLASDAFLKTFHHAQADRELIARPG